MFSRDEAKIRENSVLTMYFRIMVRDKYGKESRVRLDEISTLVLDYFDDSTGTTINSRSDQDVKNANNVVVTALGEVAWTLQADDTAVQSSSLSDGDLEKHIAVFKWTLTDGQVGSVRQAIYIITDSKV